MEPSIQGLAEIAGHEGIVLAPYLDTVGVWTIFIGHTKPAGPPDPVKEPMGVQQTVERAFEVFRQDMVKYADAVNEAVTVPLTQTEFDALLSFHYNTGRIKTATLTKKVNAGDKAGAIAEFDKWHRPPEIAARRDKEKLLFATGRYSNGGKALVYNADARGVVRWSAGRSIDVLKALIDAAIPPPPDIPVPEQPTATLGRWDRLLELFAAIARLFAGRSG